MSETAGSATVGPPVLWSYEGSARNPRSWLAASIASGAVYAVVGVLIVLFGGAARQVVEERQVDLTFVERVVKREPLPPQPVAEPPPEPVAEEKPKPPAAAAPVVRPDQKVRRVEKVKPKQLLAPKEVPAEAPPEADPSQDAGVAVLGEGGEGDPAGLEGGVARGGVAGGQVGGAVALPEEAIPPRPLATNQPPPYPREARASGKTGVVVLKVVILADGTVGEVTVIRGEEPFVGAAVAAVKTWKYEPARHLGQTIAVYRIIQLPFKLTV